MGSNKSQPSSAHGCILSLAKLCKRQVRATITAILTKYSCHMDSYRIVLGIGIADLVVRPREEAAGHVAGVRPHRLLAVAPLPAHRPLVLRRRRRGRVVRPPSAAAACSVAAAATLLVPAALLQVIDRHLSHKMGIHGDYEPFFDYGKPFPNNLTVSPG